MSISTISINIKIDGSQVKKDRAKLKTTQSELQGVQQMTIAQQMLRLAADGIGCRVR